MASDTASTSHNGTNFCDNLNNVWPRDTGDPFPPYVSASVANLVVYVLIWSWVWAMIPKEQPPHHDGDDHTFDSSSNGGDTAAATGFINPLAAAAAASSSSSASGASSSAAGGGTSASANLLVPPSGRSRGRSSSSSSSSSSEQQYPKYDLMPPFAMTLFLALTAYLALNTTVPLFMFYMSMYVFVNLDMACYTQYSPFFGIPLVQVSRGPLAFSIFALN